MRVCEREGCNIEFELHKGSGGQTRKYCSRSCMFKVFNKTPKGIARRKKFSISPKAKIIIARYQASPKGKIACARARTKLKKRGYFRRVDKQRYREKSGFQRGTAPTLTFKKFEEEITNEDYGF